MLETARLRNEKTGSLTSAAWAWVSPFLPVFWMWLWVQSFCYFPLLLGQEIKTKKAKEQTNNTLNRQYWQSYCHQQSDRFLKLTSLLQALVTQRYVSISVSFQDVYGELIWMVQNRPVQRHPFISNVWERFGFPWLSKKWKSRRKKKSQQKFQCSRRPTGSSRQKAQPDSIDFTTWWL